MEIKAPALAALLSIKTQTGVLVFKIAVRIESADSSNPPYVFICIRIISAFLSVACCSAFLVLNQIGLPISSLILKTYTNFFCSGLTWALKPPILRKTWSRKNNQHNLVICHPKSHIPDPKSHIPHPKSHIRNSTSHIRNPTSHIRNPTSYIKQPIYAPSDTPFSTPALPNNAAANISPN